MQMVHSEVYFIIILFSIVYASLFIVVHFVETFQRFEKTFLNQFLKIFMTPIQDHLDITIRHTQFVTPLQRNSLYCAVRLANLEGILGLSVLSTILVKAGLMKITMSNAHPAWLRMTSAA